MWLIAKRIIKSIILTIISFALLLLVSTTVLMTIIFYYEQPVPTEVMNAYAIISSMAEIIAIPLLLALFLGLEFTNKLPDVHIRKENIRKLPALLISFNSVKNGILWWLALGLLPFLLLIVVSTIILRDQMIVIIPAGALYTELAFVYLLYKKLKVTA